MQTAGVGSINWLYQYKTTRYTLCRLTLERASEMHALATTPAVGFDDTLEDLQQHIRLAGKYAYAFIDEATNQLVSTVAAVVMANETIRIMDVLTAPQHRKRGLATMILQHLIRELRLDPSLPSCLELEASSEGCELYKKLGFTIDYEISSFSKKSVPIQDDSFPNERLTEADIADICKLDKAACGIFRGMVISEVPKSQILVDRQEKIEGFLFYFQDASGIRIGPWVHATAEGAEKLLQRALHIIGSKYGAITISVHTPHDQNLIQETVAMRILKEHGFLPTQLKTYHMSLGMGIDRAKQSYHAIWSTNWR